MDFSKLYAVIADDDSFKVMDIHKALNFCGINDVVIVHNQEKLWEEKLPAFRNIGMCVV